MQIIISEEAVHWYKTELDIVGPTYIRFYVRYGGIGGNVPGFSLGITIESPSDMHTSIKVDNITFFIEKSDRWYFEDKDLFISFDEQLNEPQFTYKTT